MSNPNERMFLAVPATHTAGTYISGLIELLCREVAERHQLSDSFVFQIVSAFQEAFNNIVVHAYQGEEGGVFELSVVVDDVAITIEMFDRGLPIENQEPIVELMDFSSFAPDALPEGGMGMSIMHSCMDLVRYASSDGKNQVKMTKFFGKEKEKACVSL